MTERKIAVAAFFVVTFMAVVVALAPVANADACNDECYKGCDKGAKEDVPSCKSTCDDMCRLKSMSKLYAAATPAEKAAVAKTFETEEAAAGPAAASTPGFARLNAGCHRECSNNLCRGGAGKKDDDPAACATRCDNVCRAEVDGLAFASKAYAESPATEKEAIILAIDKHANGPDDKVEALAAICINDCSKLCDKDPACDAICDDGCRGRSVNLAYSLSTLTQKEEIKKEIDAVSPTASKLLEPAS